MRFSTSAFAPACASPNPSEADPLRLYPDASGGEAAVTRYRVFPGMELDYRDVHARACRELRDGSGERLEIHHCLEGRVEYRQNGRYFYLSPGDLAVARTSSLPPDSRFPTGHYHGITVTIDPAAAPECLFPSFHDEDGCYPIFLYMPGIAGGYQQMQGTPLKVASSATLPESVITPLA